MSNCETCLVHARSRFTHSESQGSGVEEATYCQMADNSAALVSLERLKMATKTGTKHHLVMNTPGKIPPSHM